MFEKELRALKMKKGVIAGKKKIVPEAFVRELAYRIWEVTRNPDHIANYFEAIDMYVKKGASVVSDEEWQEKYAKFHESMCNC